MRKYLLMVIALFVTGQVCKAQSLLSGDKLKTEKTVTVNIPQKAPKLADAEAKEYWATAQSYYNEYTEYLGGDELRTCGYSANVTFDGEDVTISGLIDVSNFTYFYPLMTDIHGHYDATAHTITIQTPVYESSKAISSYTSAGTMEYYGSNLTLALFSGNFSDTPDANGQYALETISELVFDVSEDLSTITSRSGFGCYGFYSWDDSPAGFLDYYKSATLNLLTDEAKLSVSPSTINFDGASVTVGATLTSSVSLTNMSLASTKYTTRVTGDGLTLYASDNIGAKATEEYKVVLKPTKVGAFTGTITFIAENGSEATTTVTANVGEAPDFSKIVKEGDFTFFYGSDYPFVVTDTITGYPVAVSTNVGSGTTSTLNASVTVPEGKTGVISWKGTSVSMQPNGVKISLDSEKIYDNTYSFNGLVGHDDISNMVVVGSGDHVVSFVNNRKIDWYAENSIKDDLKAWIYDLSLTLVDEASDAAVIREDNADFGRHYYDKLSVSDTAVVNLVNVGSNNLKLTSVTGTDNFTAVVDGAEAGYGENLPVNLVFTGNAIGEYAGDVVLHTTAGDFTVNCKASAEKIIYDYSPIVTEGTFSFNTSFDYPFIVEADSARSNIAGLSPVGVDLTAWLDAAFEVPEGQEGILSWRANNSSLDFFEFMGDEVFDNGSYIIIDNGERREFAGEDENCSSNVYDAADLVFQAGRHNIRFAYTKISSDVAGLDRLVVSKLGLHLQTSGILGVKDNRTVTKTEVYSVEGKKLNAIQPGLNIVRRVFSDGTSETYKQLAR